MIQILISIIGFFFEVRLLKRLSRKISIISYYKKHLLYFSSCFSLIGLLVSSECFQKTSDVGTIFLLLGHFFLNLTLLFLPQIIVSTSKRNFRANFLTNLDEILLYMSSGMTFRQSLQAIIGDKRGIHRIQLVEILNQITLMNEEVYEKDDFIKEIIFKFKEIDTTNTKSIEQVRFFRNQLRIRSEFALKARQAKEQAWIQVWMLSFLYIVVMIFSLYKFGWEKNSALYLISLILFISGITLVLFIGEKKSWTV